MVKFNTWFPRSQQGFTLVELIVVITILAILGTIGFISLQGYSAQSRDAKRTSDLRSLLSAVNNKVTSGISLTNTVDATTNAKLSAWNLAGQTATWYTVSEYTAWIPNFTVLWINQSSFKDGVNDYRFGATSKNGGAFQFAAKLENGGISTAYVSGNYNPRTAAVYTPTVVTASSLTTPYTLTGLPATSIGNLEVGDTIWIITSGTSGTGRILTVSWDGTSASVSSSVATGNVTSVQLGSSATLASNNEATGLIGKIGALNTPVTNQSTTDFPY